ncbi:hypothetical protein [Flammeovirga kamogawensis]|uniref:Uncharacterized protein n=1 Tax=Flammeovirga kamogawensis TaxID=373891 RepID=A0ABX8H223_9BACT|nr:hypothetical protein [Flammeovirga kamogawensis]MBB6463764.1 hypothetical protein [Flammeovirga kamogawensis]QWG09724.1 hypothetical protein KM029_24305 [Flammeovirga kamogawensis]TRX65237.1 hypothetical protein EO216_22195 [Flammeovirga kamogawensis]
MYFEGNITIDPSQLTQIEKVKPTKAFKRMLHYLTMGNVSDKVERETFSALSILQQLNTVLFHSNIDNIVRLSHDGIDFYLDTQGKEGDLKEAFDAYDLEVDTSMSVYFKKLVMIMEHEDHNFKYLLEIDINRTHDVGEYPIAIKINGLLKQFNSKGKERSSLENEMKDLFQDQEKYNAFKLEKQHLFEAFLQELKVNIKSLMKVDDVKLSVKSKIIVPTQKVASKENIRYKREYGDYGIHYGYYGFDDFLFYSMLWSNMSHNNNITIQDSFFETELGHDMGYMESVDASSDYFNDEITSNFDDFNTDTSSSSDDIVIDDYGITESESEENKTGGWFDLSDNDTWSDDDDFGSDDDDDW